MIYTLKGVSGHGHLNAYMNYIFLLMNVQYIVINLKTMKLVYLGKKLF